MSEKFNKIKLVTRLAGLQIQNCDSLQSSKLAHKAYEYYLKQIKDPQKGIDEDTHYYRTHAAYNMFALSFHKRIDPFSDAENVNYLQIAADGGHGQALNHLGAAYFSGLYNLGQDSRRAEKLYKKASTKGYLTAKINLMMLQFRKKSIEATAEGNTLFNELWTEASGIFKPFLENLILSVTNQLEEVENESSEEDDSEGEDSYSQLINDIEKEEKLVQQRVENDLVTNEEYPTTEEKKQILSLKFLKKESKEPEQEPIKLTKKEKEHLEEKEQLLRKCERMAARVEALRSKKQTKYRKLHTLMNQHIEAYGGGVKNAKGSGRRIKVGGTHSGFHKPHKADIKAGALRSLTDVMEMSSQK